MQLDLYIRKNVILSEVYPTEGRINVAKDRVAMASDSSLRNSPLRSELLRSE
ncbi:MAG TPA: hypothetical protein VFD13_01490 [Candidatus Kapabacteria bacterium]|nr:hypothetical protein [Candidatus Kapabacteria bacterium]